MTPHPTWRPSKGVRYGVLVAIPATVLLSLGLIVRGLVDGNSRWWAAAVILIPAAYGASWGRRYCWLTYIAMRQNGVAVRNGRREIVIPWDEVTGVTPGYSGIAINRRNGTTVTAAAVQKTNLARWLGMTDTRADSVVATIEAHARSHGAELR